MKQMTEYNRISGYLNKIYNLCNARFFENALPKVVLTIQSTPRAYGHITCSKVWKNEDGTNRHEINIGAGTLARPIENIVATLVHEMVHLYCMENGIKDTSRGTTYHNKKFKQEAEKRALHIEHNERIGYSITTPTDELIQFCLDNDLTEILLERQEGFAFVPPSPGTKTGNPTPTPPTPTRKPSSTRKYICPNCRASVRATRDILLICGECHAKDGSLVHLEKSPD